MASSKVNQPTKKTYTLKQLKKKVVKGIGTGDGGVYTSKGLGTVKK